MSERHLLQYRKLFRPSDILAFAAVGIAYAASIAALLVLLREFVLALDGGSNWPLTPVEIGGLLAVTAILHAGLRMLEFTVPEEIGFLIVQRLRVRLYRHMAAMMPDQIRHRSRGSLILRLTGDLTMLRTWLSRGIGRGIIAGLSLIVSLGVIANFSLAIAGVISLFLVTGAVFSLLAGRRLQKLTARVRRRRSTLTSNIDEQVHALATVQLFGRMGGEDARLRRQNYGLTKALMQEAWWRGSLRGISALMSWGALVGALFVGFYLLQQGMTDLGTIVAALIAARLMQGFVTNLSLSHDYWRRAEISRSKLEDFLNSRSRLLTGDGEDKLVHNRATIAFEGVTIGDTLTDFTASLPAGQHAALVGPDGGARQAVLDAVTKMAVLDEGQVMVGKQDLADCRVDTVWKKIGYISPDLHLMRGTLRRNLSYRRRSLSDEELNYLIEGVGLDSYISRLPDGLDHWLTEGGANLPADIRQLVRIVRGLAGNPPILLLDRPCSALDDVQSAKVRRFIANYSATIFTISDDPQDFRTADTVWTFDAGRLVRIESSNEYDQRARLPTIPRGNRSGLGWPH
ncbi:ABC transporter transmembrane domain-containing protein [Sphingomicrobium lutaoense]|uniref:ABC-type multidrug transport system fused ATPase/permease subunit n=1 Tax=Sphingomicrobium lutaoense TaxID=515949 RepID=A0A839Z360_9SPHN|nr:ABC transporter ATP-binding protein [Sphingomicrobium lutaoense]MBB3764052.1 ABC-type multidrug transport system fused ATPase/permease subunit [Sphingomicrobium lutaoense]